MLYKMIAILFLAFIQNVSFSIVSRSRNRDNIKYHIIAATFSNTIWFITFRQLVKAEMDLLLFVPYVIGTVAGSCLGVKLSMFIERLLGASAESHLRKPIAKPKSATVPGHNQHDSNAMAEIRKVISSPEGQELIQSAIRKVRCGNQSSTDLTEASNKVAFERMKNALNGNSAREKARLEAKVGL